MWTNSSGNSSKWLLVINLLCGDNPPAVIKHQIPQIIHRCFPREPSLHMLRSWFMCSDDLLLLLYFLQANTKLLVGLKIEG